VLLELLVLLELQAGVWQKSYSCTADISTSSSCAGVWQECGKSVYFVLCESSHLELELLVLLDMLRSAMLSAVQVCGRSVYSVSSITIKT
jgi:hypothetical protein